MSAKHRWTSRASINGRVSPRGGVASWEWAFAVVSLLVLANTLDRTIHSELSRGTVLAGIPFARIVLLPTYAGAFLLLAFHRRTVVPLLRVSWPVFLPLPLALASVLWSSSPAVTTAWTLGLAGTTAFGVYLALRFAPEKQLILLALTLGAAACLCALVGLLLPRYGVVGGGKAAGSWMAIFEHKNILGRLMALAALSFTLLALESRRLRFLSLLGLGLSAFLVFASTSRGAILVMVTCVTGAGILRALQIHRTMRRSALASLAVVAILLAIWGSGHFDQILEHLGREHTLTGRTRIWAAALDQAGRRPWLGYGYGAFWRIAADEPGGVTDQLKRLSLDHGHNGFLDLALELGIVGVAAFVVPFALYARRSFSWALAEASAARLLPITYLLFFAVSNLAESSLVRHQIFWALYVSSVVTVARSPGRG